MFTHTHMCVYIHTCICRYIVYIYIPHIINVDVAMVIRVEKLPIKMVVSDLKPSCALRMPLCVYIYVHIHIMFKQEKRTQDCGNKSSSTTSRAKLCT